MPKNFGLALALAAIVAMPVTSQAQEAGAGPRSWTRSLESCTGKCEELFGSLAPEDANTLRGLPERVARTIEEFDGEDYELLPARVQGALELVQGLGGTTAIALDPGMRGCTVIWFGFLDEGGSVVGRHQCRIDEKDGERWLTKLPGEGLFVRLVELEGGNVAVGRTYLPEQKERRYDRDRPNNSGNGNFGNFVGLAVPSERNGLVSVRADMHGHTEPDATFFEMLVVE